MTVTNYSKDFALWILAGDMYINTSYFGKNVFLNEVPMADYLDQMMQEEDSPIQDYMFYTSRLEMYL